MNHIFFCFSLTQLIHPSTSEKKISKFTSQISEEKKKHLVDCPQPSHTNNKKKTIIFANRQCRRTVSNVVLTARQRYCCCCCCLCCAWLPSWQCPPWFWIDDDWYSRRSILRSRRRRAYWTLDFAPRFLTLRKQQSPAISRRSAAVAHAPTTTRKLYQLLLELMFVHVCPMWWLSLFLSL